MEVPPGAVRDLGSPWICVRSRLTLGCAPGAERVGAGNTWARMAPSAIHLGLSDSEAVPTTLLSAFSS